MRLETNISTGTLTSLSEVIVSVNGTVEKFLTQRLPLNSVLNCRDLAMQAWPNEPPLFRLGPPKSMSSASKR